MSSQTKFNFKSKQDILFFPRTQKKARSKTIWWAPVWNGLVLDDSARHYKVMGRALWLYLYLLIYANRRTGKLFRKIPTVSRDTGINIRTIRRWIQVLKQNGYIETRRTGRSLEISITRWKPIK